MNADLEGRGVLVTGGAGLIGTEICRRLAHAGARVHVVDSSRERLASLEELSSIGDVHLHRADITKKEQLLNLEKTLTASGHTIDSLINNAAAKSSNFFDPFESFPEEDWHQVMSVNLTAGFLCSQIFGPAMARRGMGSILFVSSIYGVVGPDQRIYEGSMYLGQPINTPAVYSASKAGVIGLARYLATYWGDRNVRVNVITPGGVESGQNENFVNNYSRRVPLGRMGTAREVAAVALFLVSDQASYITGQNLLVDGGWTAW